MINSNPQYRNSQHRNSHSQRTAVTLVEVLFSIGVIMIGLLGLLSVMPLAGQRAQDSVSFSVGAEVADSVAKEIQIRRWLNAGGLGDMNNAPKYSIAFDEATNQMSADPLDQVPTVTMPASDLIGGICIDPLYCANQAGTYTSFASYDDRVFPYYVASHDPLLDPSDTNSASWAPPMPRLRRVGVIDPSTATIPATTIPRLVALEIARELTQSANDLLVVSTKADQAESATLPGLGSGILGYGRRVPTGEYSWIATLVPTQSNQYASLSVAIIRNRVTDIDFPVSAPPTPVQPDANGVSERVAYVTYASGFSGGAGGVVHLTASGNTSAELAPNDWLMMSRVLPDGTQAHRWYRVVAIDADPEELVAYSNTELDSGGAALPTISGSPDRTERALWRRRITLDGPDWEFDFTTGQISDGTFLDNTYVTIVQNVVSVTERLIPWTDL
ncbi:type IV pilus modification PilV family protein [Neorhodopirellula lusitana]|uniref:type IV pilus modification PilV family protein n=1 Tax=Neorhodopirellula lusitana TaxID=445327 RepID=UPI003850B811